MRPRSMRCRPTSKVLSKKKINKNLIQLFVLGWGGRAVSFAAAIKSPVNIGAGHSRFPGFTGIRWDSFHCIHWLSYGRWSNHTGCSLLQ